MQAGTLTTDHVRNIDLDEEWERGFWSERLGVSVERLDEAVKAVGGEVSAVKQYLNGT